MANPWRKALSSFLSIVLMAGLLPCASFYGSAWASDAEGEASASDADQVAEGSPDADAVQIAEASPASDAAQASESTQLAAVAQPADSTQFATAAQSSTETLPFGNTISAAGEDHSAAITQNGELWTWGRNNVFQLGYLLGPGDDYSCTPNKLMDDVASVALATNFSAAVKNNGELWMWGYNGGGVVGNEDTGSPHGFAPAKLMDDVVSVSLGYLHAAAIKRDGSLWTWGENSHGELGDGTTNDNANYEPKMIMNNVAAVSLGTGYSAAIDCDGALWMWGDNSKGQFGNGTTESSTTPIKVMDGVSAVSLGGSHTGVIMTDGSLLTWGWNLDGQLGNGTTEDSRVPVKVMDDVASISFRGCNSSAVKKDGTLWVWGDGAYNQVGVTYWDQLKPVQYLEGVVCASVGMNHTAALKQDGTLWTWGCNNYGQLGYMTLEQQWTPYQVMDKVALPAGSSGAVPSETIPSDPFTASAWFKASGGDGEAATVVNWDDAWFNTSSYTYNHDLATTAAVLAAAAYDESFVKKTLRDELGFNAFDSVEYHPEGKDYNGDYDQVGYSIETRMTSNGVPIIAVIVRGTPGNGEWLSNLNVADTLQNSDQETHEGFKAGALQVLRALRSYVYDNGIDLDKARVLIAGHSRGAAVSNILGARLDDGLTTDAGTLSPDNVYTFTFESPNATRASNRSDAKYGNIFNIVNPEDVVIKVPLGEWGYGRYGNDLALPSRSNTLRGDYKAQLAKMNEYFERFSDGEKYRGYLTGAVTASSISTEMAMLARSTWWYYHNRLAGVTPHEVFTSLVKAAIMDSADNGDYAVLYAAMVIPQYKLLFTAIFGTGALNGAFITGKGVVHGHTQETYVAWMKSEEAALGEFPEIFARKNYRSLLVACPVDVKVYDAEGNLVASISNDEVDETLLEEGLPAAVTSDGVKMIDIPAGGDYRVEVTATDGGEMDVTVEERDVLSSDPVSVKSYQGVAIEEGDVFSLDASAQDAPADCVLVDDSTGDEAKASSVASGSDLEKATVSVSAEGEGDVWGGGTVVAGGKIAIHARASEGSVFIGWQREGASGEREAVAGGADIEVRASEDVTYVAQFASIPSEFPDVDYAEWYAEGVSFCSAKGLITGYAEGPDAGLFGVGRPLTRAQFAMILWRAADPDAAAAYKPADTPNTTGMDDVESFVWYTGAANWAVANQVINGFNNGDGTFSFMPNEPVTAEQVAKIFCNYANGGQAGDLSALGDLTDSDAISDWAVGSVAWAKESGLVSGYDNHDGTFTFAPSESTSRERAATLIMKAYRQGILK